MCGESRLPSPRSALPVGSPPHVWGKLLSPLPDAGGTRITPTCVGKARGRSRLHGVYRGSPPHVWGKQIVGIKVEIAIRITPTCVGKAQMGRHQRYKIQDHPHMCGESPRDKAAIAAHTGSPPHVWESLFFLLRFLAIVGSPPHVWGKPSCETINHNIPRITPTCVGKARRKHSPQTP